MKTLKEFIENTSNMKESKGWKFSETGYFLDKIFDFEIEDFSPAKAEEFAYAISTEICESLTGKAKEGYIKGIEKFLKEVK